MTITIRAKIALLVLLAAAACSAVLVLQHAGGASAAPSAADPPADFSPNANSTDDPSSVFAALKRSPNTGDRDNAAIVKVGEQQPWLAVSGARRIADNSDGAVWLTPTTDGRVCLSLQTADYTATTCDTVKRARVIGIVLGTAGRYVGAVPDNATATLSHGDGSTDQLATDGGVFDVPAGAGELIVDGTAGRYHLAIG